MESKNVLGVLAGRDLAPGSLEAWLAWADIVVAADGGADLCREVGREPDHIVGDLDSIKDRSGLTPDLDQDSSDVDKLLAFINNFEDSDHQLSSISQLVLIGVEGDRLDHVLATLFSCTRYAEILCPRLILRSGCVIVLVGPDGTYQPMPPSRISLIPLGRCRVTLQDAEWPLEDEVLEPQGRISLSNRTTGDALRMTVHEGAVAVFLEGFGLPSEIDA